MNNQFLKRLASAFISGCLLLSGQAVFADTNADNVFAVPTISENRASENENVRIIVELKEEPLLAYGAAIHTYAAASDFLSSKEAKEIEQSLAQNRTAVKKALVKNGVDLTVTHEYSAVINGFSVEASVSDLQAIKETDGVKDAFIAEFYSLPEPINTASGGVSAIGSDLVGEEFGYTGKNSAVAILDTGLDLSHPAFASVNSPKYSKDDIEEVLQNNKMTIGKLNVSKVYINDKIPYAYDYADVDTNVSGGDSHGTHVAGIVGANSGGVVEGVATAAIYGFIKKTAPSIIVGPEAVDGQLAADGIAKKTSLIPTLILVAVLVLATPLGLLATGDAWGEWDAEGAATAVQEAGDDSLQASVGLDAPTFADALPTGDYLQVYSEEQGLGFAGQAAMYILSGVIGVAVLTIAFRLVSLTVKESGAHDNSRAA